MSERSRIEILTGKTREGADAVLIDGVSESEIETADSAWQSFLQPILEAQSGLSRSSNAVWRDFVIDAYRTIMERGGSLDDLPENLHWNWRDKDRGQTGRAFGIECQGEMQGLMLVRTDKMARLADDAGKPLLYVDYLATAPWNLSMLTDQPRFRQIGFALMTVAATLSIDLGWSGRVGLHSLPGAENFYRLGQNCGMTDLGIDTTYEGLRYFEMRPAQANDLIARAKGSVR